MIPINYVKGDATDPQGDGKKIIIHVCNDVSGWGAGFVLALSRRWKEPEEQYRRWAQIKGKISQYVNIDDAFRLGNVKYAKVTPDIAVANMIAQRDIKKGDDGTPPIRYGALRECLKKVAKAAKQFGASVHLPYLMGSGLAGGKWDTVEGIIKEELCTLDIPVTIYDFT